MCITDCHNMTFNIKVALNPNAISQSKHHEEENVKTVKCFGPFAQADMVDTFFRCINPLPLP